MTLYEIGPLSAVRVSERPDLLAPRTRDAILASGSAERVGVVEIDPAVSDTAASREAFALPADAFANCVIVTGSREGVEKIAACVVLADTRADVNGLVRRLLDVRKASFLAHEKATEATAMEHGGITPIGLPPEWPVYVDARVTTKRLIVLGSGIRASKIILPGHVLASLAGVQTVEGLGRPAS